MDAVVLAKDVPHPFGCYALSTVLDPKAFEAVEGSGPYERYTWNPDGSDFGVDIEIGTADPFNMDACDLFDNDDAITIVRPQANIGYRYPKSNFALVRKSKNAPSFVAGGTDLLERYKEDLSIGHSLALLPVSRLRLEDSELPFPGGVTFYQQGKVDLAALNCVPNDNFGHPLSKAKSSITRVTIDTLNEHVLAVCPVQMVWSRFISLSHTEHMDFIADLSHKIDRTCFDYILYRLCDFYPVDSLPGRIGSLDTHPMFSAVLLYDPQSKRSQIVSGSVFSHMVVRGIGLLLHPLDAGEFPTDGEVGRIAKHALTLYRSILESSSHTSRFVQAMSLLEFLAFPDDYRPFKEVKKIVASHAARSEYEYRTIIDRFLDLTGKKDPVTNEFLGFRTRIVHMGQRIEEIVPREIDRKTLFAEIYGYIRAMMDHMIAHSDLTFVEYGHIRRSLFRWSS
ncbi:MAG TPA: hypothetical protein DCQ94_17200 [Nitrospira sp.]|nr:hypothetical protein [Nitrospira sp.]